MENVLISETNSEVDGPRFCVENVLISETNSEVDGPRFCVERRRRDLKIITH
jgi:hypothetical protein